MFRKDCEFCLGIIFVTTFLFEIHVANCFRHFVSTFICTPRMMNTVFLHFYLSVKTLYEASSLKFILYILVLWTFYDSVWWRVIVAIHSWLFYDTLLKSTKVVAFTKQKSNLRYVTLTRDWNKRKSGNTYTRLTILTRLAQHDLLWGELSGI